MEFEWDNNKNEHNFIKHGVDFSDAAKVFLDEKRITRENTRKDYRERRYQTIGMLNQVIMFVVYTWRSERLRLISARRAHKNERKIYIQTREPT